LDLKGNPVLPILGHHVCYPGPPGACKLDRGRPASLPSSFNDPTLRFKVVCRLRTTFVARAPYARFMGEKLRAMSVCFGNAALPAGQDKRSPLVAGFERDPFFIGGPVCFDAFVVDCRGQWQCESPVVSMFLLMNMRRQV
jgi:hypothetical protein